MGAKKSPGDDPVSLAPLTPEEALRALLAVKPGTDEDPPREVAEGSLNEADLDDEAR